MITQETDRKFYDWCDELDRIAKEKYDYGDSHTTITGREAWRCYFDSGYSPEDAIREDASNS